MSQSSISVNVLGDQVALVVMDCASCGVIYAITQDYRDRRQQDGQGWSCPNGHSNVFTKTEADRLREQLALTEKRAEFYRQLRHGTEERLQSERRRHAATKGQLTKTRKLLGGES